MGETDQENNQGDCVYGEGQDVLPEVRGAACFATTKPAFEISVCKSCYFDNSNRTETPRAQSLLTASCKTVPTSSQTLSDAKSPAQTGEASVVLKCLPSGPQAKKNSNRSKKHAGQKRSSIDPIN